MCHSHTPTAKERSPRHEVIRTIGRVLTVGGHSVVAMSWQSCIGFNTNTARPQYDEFVVIVN